MVSEIKIFGLRGMPSIEKGDDLGRVIVDVAKRKRKSIVDGDVIVIAQKIISKSEGRIVDIRSISPSKFAKKLAKRSGKLPQHVEAILGQTKEIVRMEGHHLITETHHGFVCANAGVDKSNVRGEWLVSLLPRDSDASAQRIRKRIKELTGKKVAVIISDTFGRPWRIGQTNLAIGVTGMKPLVDYRGRSDMYGQTLKLTVIAVADELASAGELVMNKYDRVPVAIIRGYAHANGKGSIKEIIRPKELDLFR